MKKRNTVSEQRRGGTISSLFMHCLLLYQRASALMSRHLFHPSSLILHPSSLNLIIAFLLVATPVLLPGALAQSKGRPDRSGSSSRQSHESSTLIPSEVVERAISVVCDGRKDDPLGSLAIDEMQARPSLPLTDPTAIAGAQRAERLLPVAQKLTVAALRRLAGNYKIPAWRVRAAALRIRAVKKIEPDMELRDNASVYLNEQHTIYFGTIFLAGLPSDEGMISVIAHELTHIADGPKDFLHPLFRLLGHRAANLTGLQINGRRPEELTCDLVGAMTARSFIARTPSDEALARRLARCVQHNCVEEDETDEHHLSPRNTMRALLALDPTLGRDLIGDGSPLVFSQSIKQQRQLIRSLTTASAPSYHHQFK
ncbi:MAG TPA: hypothetical protein VD966_01630 [Pyrinomonadaceae bacterium]|nr:hypothetical protein [Pyrinomonadaceae bacterium]